MSMSRSAAPSVNETTERAINEVVRELCVVPALQYPQRHVACNQPSVLQPMEPFTARALPPSFLRQHPVLLVGRLTEAQRSHFSRTATEPGEDTRSARIHADLRLPTPFSWPQNLTEEGGHRPKLSGRTSSSTLAKGGSIRAGGWRACRCVCVRHGSASVWCGFAGGRRAPCEMGGRGPAAGVWGRVSGKAGFVCLRGAFWLAGEVWGRWRQYCWDGVRWGGGGV
jgi:hypothetical protein